MGHLKPTPRSFNGCKGGDFPWFPAMIRSSVWNKNTARYQGHKQYVSICINMLHVTTENPDISLKKIRPTALGKILETFWMDPRCRYGAFLPMGSPSHHGFHWVMVCWMIWAHQTPVVFRKWCPLSIATWRIQHVLANPKKGKMPDISCLGVVDTVNQNKPAKKSSTQK